MQRGDEAEVTRVERRTSSEEDPETQAVPTEFVRHGQGVDGHL